MYLMLIIVVVFVMNSFGISISGLQSLSDPYSGAQKDYPISVTEKQLTRTTARSVTHTALS